MRNFYLGQLLVVGLLVGFGIFHFAYRALFYIEVEGTIVETKVKCFSKDGNRAVYSDFYSTLEVVDCNAAPALAKANGFRPAAIQKGTVYKVSWASPIDNSIQTAQEYATGIGGLIVVGKKRRLHASNSDPTEMQWN